MTAYRDVAVADALGTALASLPAWTTLEPAADAVAVLEWPDVLPVGPRVLIHPPLLAAHAAAADALQWRCRTGIEIHLPLAIRDALTALGAIRDGLARASVPGLRILKVDLVECVRGKYTSAAASSVVPGAAATASRWETASAVAHAARLELDFILVT